MPARATLGKQLRPVLTQPRRVQLPVVPWLATAVRTIRASTLRHVLAVATYCDAIRRADRRVRELVHQVGTIDLAAFVVVQIEVGRDWILKRARRKRSVPPPPAPSAPLAATAQASPPALPHGDTIPSA